MDAAQMREWLRLGARDVKQVRADLNAINVFPVPDSDTGTNMYLTLKEGNRAVSRLLERDDAEAVAAAFSRGALIGARGNSGVILAQYLSGVLQTLAVRPQLSAQDLAQALTDGAVGAYQAVLEPVEGTMLTVARVAAETARAAAQTDGQSASVVEALIAAVTAAHTELRCTPEILPAARAAGVLDAGAAGLVLQLEALLQVVAGPEVRAQFELPAWKVKPLSESELTATAALVLHQHDVLEQGTDGAYEVMFAAHPNFRPDPEIRQELTAALGDIGDSVAVAGGGDLWQAHVHTDDPAAAVSVALAWQADHIIVRNIIAGVHAGVARGLLILTRCSGLADQLADTGATVLVVPNTANFSPRSLVPVTRDTSVPITAVACGSSELRELARTWFAKKKRSGVTVLPVGNEAQLVTTAAEATVFASAAPTSFAESTGLSVTAAELVGHLSVVASQVKASRVDWEQLPTAIATAVDTAPGPIFAVTIVLPQEAESEREKLAEQIAHTCSALETPPEVQIFAGGFSSREAEIGLEYLNGPAANQLAPNVEQFAHVHGHAGGDDA